MNITTVALAVMAGLSVSAAAQDVTIGSINGNGTMSFRGVQIGTTATVEWAASLTDTGRTNWHALTNVIVTHEVMTNDIPMFFRVRGMPAANLDNGLVAYYPFAGNAQDASGNGNHGVAQGATLTADRHGKAESAYLFNISTYIEVPNSPSLQSPTSAVSICAWVRFDLWHGYGADHGIVLCKGSRPDNNPLTARQYGLDYGKWKNTLNLLDQVIDIPLQDSPVQLGQWHHLTTTYDGALATAFIDGVTKGTLITNCVLPVNTDPLTIGVDMPGMAEYTIGAIDEVRIYNRALTSNEVVKVFGLEE